MMCTSLVYRDLNDAAYFGRTMELDVDEPWSIAYVPVGQAFRSVVEDHDPMTYTAKHGFVAASSPEHLPSADGEIDPADLKANEGLNDAGLTFSLLAYPSSGGGKAIPEDAHAALQAVDLGSWILSQFSSVTELKDAMLSQPVSLTRLELIGGIEFPFHVAVHDRTGASAVLEWDKGVGSVYDNPVGVLTNGPQFPWHLTNLNNWTHLSNVDHSSSSFGALEVNQPDSGIATASLPPSATSVGRFIRAAYYAKFAEKVADPDDALITLSRIMNTFDRPRDITIALPDAAGEGMKITGVGRKEDAPSTEYAVWTNLTDLSRGLFFLRMYNAFNYTKFDLGRLAAADAPRVMPLSQLDPMGGDGTDALLAATIS